MKWLFILLLIANVFYLAWEMDREVQLKRVDRFSEIETSSDIQKLEILNEMKRLPKKRNRFKLDTKLSMDNVKTETLLQSDTTSTMTAVNNADIVETTGNSSFIVSKKSEMRLCFIFGPILSLKESRLLSDWLNYRNILYKKRQTENKGKQLSWVYLTPHDPEVSEEATMSHVSIKRDRKIKLISEDDLSDAISLGLFSNQAAANRRLNKIKLEGYEPVVIPYWGGKKTHWFDVTVVKNVNNMNDIFTGLPVQFNPLSVDCNAIAMQ